MHLAEDVAHDRAFNRSNVTLILDATYKQKRRVIIESPYRGVDEFQTERNLKYLRRCLRDSLHRGEAPFASHGLYTQTGVLDDTNPVERIAGMDAGFAWIDVADATVVYTDLGISQGMHDGIKAAITAGKNVEYRKLDD